MAGGREEAGTASRSEGIFPWSISVNVISSADRTSFFSFFFSLVGRLCLSLWWERRCAHTRTVQWESGLSIIAAAAYQARWAGSDKRAACERLAQRLMVSADLVWAHDTVSLLVVNKREEKTWCGGVNTMSGLLSLPVDPPPERLWLLLWVTRLSRDSSSAKKALLLCCDSTRTLNRVGLTRLTWLTSGGIAHYYPPPLPPPQSSCCAANQQISNGGLIVLRYFHGGGQIAPLPDLVSEGALCKSDVQIEHEEKISCYFWVG